MSIAAGVAQTIPPDGTQQLADNGTLKLSTDGGTHNSMHSTADSAEQLGARMLDNLKVALGDAWENKLSPSERQLAQDIMDDMAGLTLTAVVTGKTYDAERAQLEAQLTGIASIEFDRTRHFVMVAAGRAALDGVGWLVKAAGPYLLAAVLMLMCCIGVLADPATKPAGPSFVIGVCQQPEASFAKWKELGINTLVDIPQGSDPAAWVKAANAANLYQIRTPVGDPRVDAGNPLLLAWSYIDEPDLKKIPAATLKTQRDAAAGAAVVRPVPWFINLAGGLVMGYAKGGPDEAAYRDLLSNADWVCNDLYPIAGWDGAIDFFSPGAAVDKLKAWSGGKPQFMYIECCRQGLTWLPDGGRSVTVAELQLLIHQATYRNVRGIIYFPLQPQSGFQWDATSPEIKAEMIRQNERLAQK